ncbi:gamma-glutamyltranspeptidase/glutathione hydrolase [Hydrogenivirga caldilitoris]|uniref:Gamma-glutamyltranspeptidase/glutathione hydrolase n=1 Tax=Hydrogenivirga caldilitoris TaxID=246264 RepID=A0A497XQJ5_9AQUI|nr:gamma-glutamyltransferase family protein [Hydrogenivirga caldilitoris]RLJ71257.1 gamma-glutamyltranspeptidase/glutathione hydrolase [Hydrogenivirga caldilitoris]
MLDLESIEGGFSPSGNGKFTEAENCMVSTAHPEATKAGVEMLRAGGNAVDAACAAALALSVCEPQASGIGGQTMMLIYTGKKVIAIDGSSRAPSLAHVNAIYREDREVGYRATTVPSTLAVLGYVHRKYGSLPWSLICEHAIRVAYEGYPITELQHRLQLRELENFKKVESFSGGRYFLKDGKPYKPGDIFKQPDLGKLLEDIAANGFEYFYQGKPAKVIDADMRENGGLLRYDDLALIPLPIERKPVVGSFRGLKVVSMPPPGAGRPLIYALHMFDSVPPDELHREKIPKVHLLIEVIREAIREWTGRPYDPNLYPQLSPRRMLSKEYARKVVKKIMSSIEIHLPIHETYDEFKGETTHLSVMDSKGMVVSLTQSIERVYGSKAAAEGLGFLYNNYLMDYEYEKVDHPYYLRPNSIPWASVAPTIVFLGDKPWLVMGSPGSERIFSVLTQFLINIVDVGMSIDKAVGEKRIHSSLGGLVSVEEDGFDEEVLSYLKREGYRVRIKDSFFFGSIQAILKTRRGTFQGVADPRRDGTAEGF